MNQINKISLLCLTALMSGVISCGDTQESNESGSSDPDMTSHTSDMGHENSVTDDSDRALVFTHKMNLKTDENRFSSLAYDCNQCTFEQWKSIVPPAGWSKGPAQVLLVDSSEMRSTPRFDGVEPAVDFLDEVEGPEYVNIAKVLDAQIIDVNEERLIVEAQVMRDTLLRFNSGRRIHELRDPEGRTFVLFAHGVDPDNVIIPDFESEALLSSLTPPPGWTYSSRITADGLDLDTPDIATVLAIRGAHIELTWELLP